MSDFDFDELDLAVNNVLGDKTTRREAENASKNSDFSADNPTDRNESIAADAPVMPTQPAADETGTEPKTPDVSNGTDPKSQTQTSSAAMLTAPAIIKPRSSINRRSQPVTSETRGGVIDIMTPPSKRPTRESSLAAPIRPAEETKPDQLAIETPPPEPEAPADTVPVEAEKTVTHDDGSLERFDTLSRSGFDFDDTNDTPSAKEPAEAGIVQLAKPDTIEPSTEKTGEETAEPSPSNQSPFLSGTKVEKRPLGSYSSFSAPTNQVASDEQPASGGEPASDALATEPAADKSQADLPILKENKPFTSTMEPDHMLTDGHEHQPAKTEVNATSTGPTDVISQQYKVADQKQDDTPRPVFDTKEYHTAAAGQDVKATRKGNGLLIASIILLLLALAVSVGVYVYGDRLGV